MGWRYPLNVQARNTPPTNPDYPTEVLGLLMTDCLVLLQKQDARYLLKPLCHELSPQPAKAPVIMLTDMHLSAIDKREKRFIIANKVTSASWMCFLFVL